MSIVSITYNQEMNSFWTLFHHMMMMMMMMIILNAAKTTATYLFLVLAVFPCRMTSYSLYEECTR